MVCISCKGSRLGKESISLPAAAHTSNNISLVKNGKTIQILGVCNITGKMSVFIAQPAVGPDAGTQSDNAYPKRWSKFKSAAHHAEERMGDAMHHAKDGVMHAKHAAAKSARSMRRKMNGAAYDTPKDVPSDN